jgi:hypothetical protein
MKVEIISTVKNGKLSPKSTNEILAILAKCEGKQVVISIEKLSRKRSSQQNRYLHLLFTQLTEVLNDLGNEFTMQEVKDMMKAKFALTDVVNTSTGEVLGQRIKGTSEMKRMELADFIDSVIRWAAELGVKLYYPNEVILMELE